MVCDDFGGGLGWFAVVSGGLWYFDGLIFGEIKGFIIQKSKVTHMGFIYYIQVERMLKTTSTTTEINQDQVE